MGVNTAYDLTLLDSALISMEMSVTGQRVKEELLGTACIPIETVMQPKQNIATTRAFGKKLSDINTIYQAVSTHEVRCAEKLRKQKSIANFLTIFIHTHPFSESQKYISKSITITLPIANNTNNELIIAAIAGLKRIYQPNILYKKTGVIVSGISNESFVQGNLFEGKKNNHFKELSKVTDTLNARLGRYNVKIAIKGKSKDWHLRQEKLSPRYTTYWKELLKVKA